MCFKQTSRQQCHFNVFEDSSAYEGFQVAYLLSLGNRNAMKDVMNLASHPGGNTSVIDRIRMNLTAFLTMLVMINDYSS